MFMLHNLYMKCWNIPVLLKWFGESAVVELVVDELRGHLSRFLSCIVIKCWIYRRYYTKCHYINTLLPNYTSFNCQKCTLPTISCQQFCQFISLHPNLLVFPSMIKSTSDYAYEHKKSLFDLFDEFKHLKLCIQWELIFKISFSL